MTNPVKFVTSVVLATVLLGAGCADFRVQDLGKSQIDFVVDAHYRETQRLLRELTIKLYHRNPAELQKGSVESVDIRIEQLFGMPGPMIFGELNLVRGTEAMQLALNVNFSGDRVFALIAGLNGMIRHAYEYQAEFYMFDHFDQQKMYDSARNVEIMVWRMNHGEASRPRPLIITNSRPGEAENLSFERLFGKLISIQDMVALIASQENNRLINRVAHGTASMVFFPL
ncbi:MAG: hypothetical protein DRR06_06685 [Gammaproteobacteria bacterium]|nr:MAG: hypothetical protein DRR06_06685 [Gammaproteobacteria bacterium]RLA50465.1 MAG: hypothetical protein DRR42_13070 [Gammaproteobacteria bacterium]